MGYLLLCHHPIKWCFLNSAICGFISTPFIGVLYIYIYICVCLTCSIIIWFRLFQGSNADRLAFQNHVLLIYVYGDMVKKILFWWSRRICYQLGLRYTYIIFFIGICFEFFKSPWYFKTSWSWNFLRMPIRIILVLLL